MLKFDLPWDRQPQGYAAPSRQWLDGLGLAYHAGINRDALGRNADPFSFDPISVGVGPHGRVLQTFGTGTTDWVGLYHPILNGVGAQTWALGVSVGSFDASTGRTVFQLQSGAVGGTGQNLYIFAEDNAFSFGFNGHRLITPKSALTTDTHYNVVIRVGATSGTTAVWIDGLLQALSSEAGGSVTLGNNASPGTLRIGANSTPSAHTAVNLTHIYGWQRLLSDGECAAFAANPWQLFEPRRLWVPVLAGGGAPTLSDLQAASITATTVQGTYDYAF